MMYDDLLQEWTLQSTDGQPVTLTFNSFDVGTMLSAPTTETSYIWTPNYPNYYPINYEQVKSFIQTKKISKILLFQEWTLKSTTEKPITLTFASFDTDTLHIVQINDKPFSGLSIPDPVIADSITVKFSSDPADYDNTGFLAEVCCSAMITTHVTGE